MTDKPNLARLLDGVPRFDVQTTIGGEHAAAMYVSDVLAALSAAPHVNETPKSEHDSADVLTALPATEKGGDANDRQLRSHEASPGVTAGAMPADVAGVVELLSCGPGDDRRKAVVIITALIGRLAAQEAQMKAEGERAVELMIRHMRAAEAAETALVAMKRERDELISQHAVMMMERDELRHKLQVMHRRAQKAEGLSQRSANLLETILLSVKEAMKPGAVLSLHSLFHRVRAARDHARSSSGRAWIEGWHYYYGKLDAAETALAAMTKERDDAVIKRAAWELEAKTLETALAAMTKERDEARSYALDVRLREKEAEDKRITAVDALAAMTKERDEARVEWQRCLDRANENYASLAAERAKVAKLVEAFELIESITVHSGGEIHGITAQHWKAAFEEAQEVARAALSEAETSYE